MPKSNLAYLKTSILQMTVIAFTALAAGQSLAAVRCENVLSSQPASAVHQVRAIIQNLAVLKIKIETAKAMGEASPLFTALKHDYALKETELLQLIQHTQINREQIRIALKNEIVRLQSEVKQTTERERLNMDEIETLWLGQIPSYAFEKSSKIIENVQDRKHLGYSPKLNSVVYLNWDRKLRVMEKSSEKIKEVGHDINIFMLSRTNANHAWVINMSWELQLLDLASNTVLQSCDLKIKDYLEKNNGEDFDSLDLSPSEEKVVLGGPSGNVLVFDTKSGELIANANNDSFPIMGLRFMNEGFAIFNGTRSVFRLNIPANTTLKEELPDSKFTFVSALDYNEKENTILVNTRQNSYTLSEHNLLPLLTVPVFSQLELENRPEFNTHVMKSIPNSKGVFMSSTGRDLAYGIYAAYGVEQPFSNFTSKYKNLEQIDGITFSQDAQQAVILVMDKEAKYHFDFWDMEH